MPPSTLEHSELESPGIPSSMTMPLLNRESPFTASTSTEYMPLQTDQLRRHNQVLSALLNLPNELLGEIILLSVLSSSREVALCEVNSPASRTAIHITHTCGRLREVALDSPSLWAYLVDFSSSNAFPPVGKFVSSEQLDCFMERSKEALLDLDLRNFGVSIPVLEEEMNEDIILRARRYGMEISERCIAQIVMSGLARCLPNLEALEIRVEAYIERSNTTTSFRPIPTMVLPLQVVQKGFMAPSLKEIMLTGCLIDFGAEDMFRNLVHLEVQNLFPAESAPSVAQWLAVFKAASASLQRIELDLAIQPSGRSYARTKFVDDELIAMANLQKMVLNATQHNCYALLCRLSISKECGVELECSSCSLDESFEYLMQDVFSPNLLASIQRNGHGLFFSLQTSFIQIRASGQTDSTKNSQLVLKFDKGRISAYDFLGPLADALSAALSKAEHLTLDRSACVWCPTYEERMQFGHFLSRCPALESLSVHSDEVVEMLDIIRTYDCGSTLLLPSLRKMRVLGSPDSYEDTVTDDYLGLSHALREFASWRRNQETYTFREILTQIPIPHRYTAEIAEMGFKVYSDWSSGVGFA